MHVGIHQLDFLNSNVVGQDSVQAISHLTGIEHTGIGTERRVNIGVGHHHPGMDTCISTTSSDNLYGLTEQCGERLLQLLLHSCTIGLDLPSMVTGAIERECDEIALH
jgi:hypothetical protein